jgi:hypothetical protein
MDGVVKSPFIRSVKYRTSEAKRGVVAHRLIVIENAKR